MDVVYAITTSSVQTATGGQVAVRAGTHWPVNDPVVLSHPNLFSADARYGLSFSTRPAALDEPPVEQVTAGPGETRGRVRRG